MQSINSVAKNYHEKHQLVAMIQFFPRHFDSKLLSVESSDMVGLRPYSEIRQKIRMFVKLLDHRVQVLSFRTKNSACTQNLSP